jgi:hypothetical protein
MATVVSSIYATQIVNLMAWSSAYAVFPIPTFVHRKGYMLESLSHRSIHQHMRKWTTRGWEFDQMLWPGGGRSKHSIQPRRRKGDRSTSKISFDCTDLDEERVLGPDDNGIQNNVFEIQWVEPDHRQVGQLPSYPTISLKFAAPTSMHRSEAHIYHFGLVKGVHETAPRSSDLHATPAQIKPN